MSFSFSNLAESLRAGTPISAEDVLAARRWAWSDGAISPAEAETIFELNHLNRDAQNDWIDFFVEAISEYVVNSQPPRGYIDEPKAAWLMAQIDRDGRVDTLAELELLVKVLERALGAPQALKSYALRQIEAVVVSGEGPTRRGGAVRPGVVDEAEIALLRRLLFASGGDSALVVSREEADLLWRIKDSCPGDGNAPGWKQLFVQAVGNHVMAYSSYRPLEHAEAARLEAFVEDHTSSAAGFIGRIFSAVPNAGFSGMFQSGRPASDHDAAVAASRAITPDEAAWLKQRAEADGSLDPLEKTLLAFVAEESGAQL